MFWKIIAFPRIFILNKEVELLKLKTYIWSLLNSEETSSSGPELAVGMVTDRTGTENILQQ